MSTQAHSGKSLCIDFFFLSFPESAQLTKSSEEEENSFFYLQKPQKLSPDVLQPSRFQLLILFVLEHSPHLESGSQM